MAQTVTQTQPSATEIILAFNVALVIIYKTFFLLIMDTFCTIFPNLNYNTNVLYYANRISDICMHTPYEMMSIILQYSIWKTETWECRITVGMGVNISL